MASALGRLILGILLLSMLFGPANKHTANDNTSGVITLIEAMHNEDIAKKAAFVFFDQEELGLLGSAFFAKKHKDIMKDKLLVNFDCVSDGDHMMFIYSKPADKSRSKLEAAFPSTEEKEAIHTDASTTLYPSDQKSFKCSVGVAAFHKDKRFGYYIDKIHTSKDTIFDERNIEFLVDGLNRFAQNNE
ncbi:MAG: M28 family peptidase [Erysipelotrichaceae bacterium]|nr:M28 family peptidase [Erysipelotrichaceae bacterium]